MCHLRRADVGPHHRLKVLSCENCDLTGTGAQDTAIATMAHSRALQANLGSRISS